MYSVFVSLVVVALAVTVTQAQMCVTRYCRCVRNPDGFITARCTLQNLEKLGDYIANPSNISTLDISSNHIRRLPSSAFVGFNNLINLSLADNDIEIMDNRSFEGLASLQYLSVKNNSLRVWRGNLSSYLPHLRDLDVTGNNLWSPSNNLLELQTLQVIRGVSWSKACVNCSLVKITNSSDILKFQDGEFMTGTEGDCRAMKHLVSNRLQLFSRHGFFSTCFEVDTKCYRTLVEAIPIHRCWDTDNYVLNIEFVLGPISVVLNALVFIITLLTPNLRKNVTMILVCNIAISDFCIAVYSILITSMRKMTYVRFYAMLDRVCPCLGFLWVTAQIVTLMTLVCLTVERYLAIVHVMAPARRMRQKHVFRCVAASWLVAIATASLPIFGIGVYTSNTYCIPLNPKKSIPHMYEFSVGITAGSILLYLFTLLLYVRIFRFVKNNLISEFKQNEGTLARRIAIMVLFNMVFFCLPVLIALLWVLANITKGMNPIVKEILTGVIPTIAFTLNSLINPLLYAYRNKDFRFALRNRMENLRGKARALSYSNTPLATPQTQADELHVEK